MTHARFTRRQFPPPAAATAERGHRTTRARQGLRHRGDVSRNVGGGLPPHVVPALKSAHDVDLEMTPLFRGRPDRQRRRRRARAAVRRLRARSRPPLTGIDRALREIRGPAAQKRRPACPRAWSTTGRHRGGPGRRPSATTPRSCRDRELDRSAEGPLGSRLGMTGFQTTYGTVSDHRDRQQFGGSETNVSRSSSRSRKGAVQRRSIERRRRCPRCSSRGSATSPTPNHRRDHHCGGLESSFGEAGERAVAFFTDHVSRQGSLAGRNAYKYFDTVHQRAVQSRCAGRRTTSYVNRA